MAARYWVGGTATWDGTAGTKWSTTSGGAGGAAAPTTADDVYFNASSTGTVTLTTGATAGTIDCTGFTGTWSHNFVTITVAGNLFKLVPGMTYNPGANAVAWNFTSASGTCQITTAGKTLGNVTFNGAGTFQLQDALNLRTDATLTLTAGTFSANNQNVSVGAFNTSNSNTRTLNMGSGLWSLTGVTTMTIWNTVTTTNLTFNKDTANVLVAGNQGHRTISPGGRTFNGWEFAAMTGSGSISITSAATLSSLVVNGPMVIYLAAVTLTAASFTFNTRADAPCVIGPQSLGNTGALSCSAGSGTVSMPWTTIYSTNYGGAGVSWDRPNSFNFPGVSGPTAYPPIVVQPNYQLGI